MSPSRPGPGSTPGTRLAATTSAEGLILDAELENQ